MVLILIDLNRFMALPLQERERKIVFRKFNLMLLWMRKWCRRSIGVEFFMLPFFCITLHIAEALKFMHEVYLLPFTWCPKSLLEICWFFFLLFFCLLLCLLFFGVKIFVLHYILFFTQKKHYSKIDIHKKNTQKARLATLYQYTQTNKRKKRDISKYSVC